MALTTKTTDAFLIQAQPAGTYGPFPLLGGMYAISAVATWGSGGTAALQFLGPDGATYVPVANGSFAANGMLIVWLPPGQYEIIVTTASNASFGVQRIKQF